MVHAYNPSTGETSQENHHFEVSLGYIVKPISDK
jgi:hypothetical protein